MCEGSYARSVARLAQPVPLLFSLLLFGHFHLLSQVVTHTQILRHPRSEDCCDLVAWTGHQNDAIANAFNDGTVDAWDHIDIVIGVMLELARDLVDQDGAELLGFGSNGEFGIHLGHRFSFVSCRWKFD